MAKKTKTEQSTLLNDKTMTTGDVPTPPSSDSVVIEHLQKEIEALKSTLDRSFAEIASRLSTVENKLEAGLSTEGAPVTGAPGLATYVPQHDAPEEYIKIVSRVCGSDFEVHTKPAQAGISFQLEIIPPPHLREIPDTIIEDENGGKRIVINDRRAKVISIAEGTAGVQSYAEKVRDFCVRWAFRNGVNYAK